MADGSAGKCLRSLHVDTGERGNLFHIWLAKMPDSELPDSAGAFVMLLHEVGGLELASREVALVMAEMLVRKVYGEEHLKTQMPSQVTDKGDRWLIEGSRRGEDHPVPPMGIHEDKVIIEIRKLDCQVLNFAQMAF